jgi:hypothetical protein
MKIKQNFLMKKLSMLLQIISYFLLFTVPGLILFLICYATEGFLFYLTGYVALIILCFFAVFFYFFLREKIKNRFFRIIALLFILCYIVEINYLIRKFIE